MERLFDLDPQLVHDSILLAVSIFVLFTALSYLLFEPAKKLLADRKRHLIEEKQTTETAKADAIALKEEYEAKLAGVDKEAVEILETARKTAKKNEAVIIEEAKAEAAKIIARANAQIDLEKKQALDDMKQEIINVASMMAGKVVSASMDTKIQDTLFEETLKEMGDKTWLS